MLVTPAYSPVVIAILLNIAVWAGITISRTYIDVLFLSNYSTDLLPQFFIAQTVVILSITLAITPLASRGSAKINFFIFLAAGASVLVGHSLLSFSWYWFPFLFSLWLSAIPVILIVVSLNAIADAFDVRRFKKLMMWINIAGNLGGLLTGLAIPLIISNTNSQAPLYLLAIAVTAGAFCFLYLPSIPVPAKRNAKGQSPFNYPLFRYVALCTFLLMIVDTFADYALKSELGQAYQDQAAIGSFMGPFYGLSNILMLVFQVAGTQTLLKLIGVAGLLSVIPWFCGISSLGLALLPNLWMAAFIRLGENVFRFSFFSVGREIAMKPLPAQIRREGKFLITAAGYIGAGLGAILLWLFADLLGLQAIALLMLLACVVWIWVAQKVTKTYQDTLEEAIKIKRFSLSSLSSDEFTGDANLDNRDNMLDITAMAFQDKDPDTIRFSFTLLEKSQAEHVPEVAYVHLDSQYFDIRVDFVRAAYRLQDQNVVPLLLKRLEIEEDGKVLWWLLKSLCHLAPNEIAPLAARWLDSPLPLARAGAVVVLLTHGTLDTLIVAANTLKAMVRSPDPYMRRGSAYAISALKIANLEAELDALLHDSVEVVSIAAMWAIADQRNMHLIPALISQLGKGRVSLYASRTLIQLGEPVVPHISDLIAQDSQNTARAAVRILSAIHGEQADQAIAKAARDGSVIIRTFLAKACAMRTKRQANSNYLARQAHQCVLNEAETIRILKSATQVLSFPESARLELIQRRRMAEARLLYWFDVATQSVELSGVIPTLLHENTSQEVASRHATALEFLESQTKDKDLRHAIAVFEETPEVTDEKSVRQRLTRLDDVWLDRILKHAVLREDGNGMDITEKVMLLRRVKLFADLPGEVLLTIAETCEDREIIKDEKLFSMGDAPDGMYIVASGSIGIQRGEQLLSELGEHDFFGELGLFDDSPRMADAVAHTDGMVLFLQKEVFDGITEDLPEVLRALVKTVIGYLK